MAREGLLTTPQVVVGLIVVTLFVPCVANFLVMVKEQGVRNTFAMVAFIVAYAFAVGGVAHRLLDTTGLFR
jgi:ferrous iron transport protein B